MLFERNQASGEPMQIEDGRHQVSARNPDDPKHHAEFPERPLVRVHRVLDHVARSLVVAEEVRELPEFALPPDPSEPEAEQDIA